MDDVLKAKRYENTMRDIGVPVSTRAVGVSVVNTYNKVMNVQANRERVPVVTIFQMYRVMLALIERKVYDNRVASRLEDQECWYSSEQFEDYKEVITSLNLCFQQVGALLRCVASFKYDDTSYVPLFPADVETPHHELVPTPEVVFLTNLRRVVMSLSNNRTAIAVRRNFMLRNSIPGAVFNQNAILTNADVIMLANYTPRNLRDDAYAVKRWIEAATDAKSSREKWFTKFSWDELSQGNESMLVSNDPENLRLVTEIDEENVAYRVEGDITRYWFKNKMSDQFI
jgi:hypothetical protein